VAWLLPDERPADKRHETLRDQRNYPEIFRDSLNEWLLDDLFR
jgi:hypothetical protein